MDISETVHEDVLVMAQDIKIQNIEHNPSIQVSEHSLPTTTQPMVENGHAEEGMKDKQNKQRGHDRYRSHGSTNMNREHNKDSLSDAIGEGTPVQQITYLGRVAMTLKTPESHGAVVQKSRGQEQHPGNTYHHTRPAPRTVFHSRYNVHNRRWPYTKPTHTSIYKTTAKPQDSNRHVFMNHGRLHNLHEDNRLTTNQQTYQKEEKHHHKVPRVGQTKNHHKSLEPAMDRDSTTQHRGDRTGHRGDRTGHRVDSTGHRGDRTGTGEDRIRQRMDKKTGPEADLQTEMPEYMTLTSTPMVPLTQTDLYSVLREDAEMVKNADSELYRRIQQHLSQLRPSQEMPKREPSVQDHGKQETIRGKYSASPVTIAKLTVQHFLQVFYLFVYISHQRNVIMLTINLCAWHFNLYHLKVSTCGQPPANH